MINDVIVAYLYTSFDSRENILKFVKNYKKNTSGYKHELLICFKLIDEKKVNDLRKILKKLKYTEFIDLYKNNDYDFGTYGRVSKKYKNKIIFFMNSHSYPIKKNWLKTIMKYYQPKTLISCTGSYESHFSSLQIKKFYKFIKFIKNYFFYKKNFNKFPNPHIRTSSFLIRGNDFYNFNLKKDYKTKKDAWVTESGKNGLTSFFKKKKYKILVINSDKKIFTENKWMLSETYCYKNQKKLLISDKHTRKYENLTKNDKLDSQKQVWGN